MYLLVCLCLMLATVLAAPVDMFDYAEDQPLERGVRLPRATCDLLSFSGAGISVNHAACAAHCLALRQGYTGGYCLNGICHCR